MSEEQDAREREAAAKELLAAAEDLLASVDGMDSDRWDQMVAMESLPLARERLHAAIERAREAGVGK